MLAREANARAVDPITPDAATEMKARSGDGDGVEDRDEDRDEELELMNPYVKHCMLLIHEQHYMELLNAGNKDASWEALELLEVRSRDVQPARREGLGRAVGATERRRTARAQQRISRRRGEDAQHRRS